MGICIVCCVLGFRKWAYPVRPYGVSNLLLQFHSYARICHEMVDMPASYTT